MVAIVGIRARPRRCMLIFVGATVTRQRIMEQFDSVSSALSTVDRLATILWRFVVEVLGSCCQRIMEHFDSVSSGLRPRGRDVGARRPQVYTLSDCVGFGLRGRGRVVSASGPFGFNPRVSAGAGYGLSKCGRDVSASGPRGCSLSPCSGPMRGSCEGTDREPCDSSDPSPGRQGDALNMMGLSSHPLLSQTLLEIRGSTLRRAQAELIVATLNIEGLTETKEVEIQCAMEQLGLISFVYRRRIEQAAVP